MPTSKLPDAFVADANVVLSSVIGGRASRAFGDPDCPRIFGAAAVRDEVLDWLPRLAAKRGFDLSLLLGVFQLLPIEWVEEDGYRRHEKEARKRMRGRDEDDWPTVALALSLGESRAAFIWTNDKDLAVAGLDTMTTAQLLSALKRVTENLHPRSKASDATRSAARPQRDAR